MKTLTKKQRREIYLKVAERVFDYMVELEMDSYLCCELSDELNSNDVGISIEEIFPEFWLFNPRHIVRDVWFTHDDDDNPNGSRIICMLLSAEMCKP